MNDGSTPQQPGQQPDHGTHPTALPPTAQQPQAPYGDGFAPVGGTSPFDAPAAYGAYAQAPQPAKPRSKWPMAAAGVAAVGLLAGGVGGYVGSEMAGKSGSSSSAPSLPGVTKKEQPPAEPGSVQDVANRALPSVVSIAVSSGRETGSGSGVVISEDGTIITNNHVVAAGGDRPVEEVLVSFADGSRARAEVIGADPMSDIAVIQADKSDLTPITIGKSDNLSVGQDVIAIGSPLGLEGTVTTGIISALNRPVSTQGADGSIESVIDAIQTDAAINPGNSGGALVNSDGALIGINTAIATMGGQGGAAGSIGLGFAIPIDQARRVADQLMKGGDVARASLGVNVRPNEDPTQPGALVAEVVPDSAAAKAGIPEGALITGVDDRKIGTSEALVAAIRSYSPGDDVQVTYTAQGRQQTANVKLGQG